MGKLIENDLSAALEEDSEFREVESAICSVLPDNVSGSDNRPVILVDQSLKMLRMAKARIIKPNGSAQENVKFLHADARKLPHLKKGFSKPYFLKIFSTV